MIIGLPQEARVGTTGGQGGDHRRPGWGPQEARVGTTGGQGGDHRRSGWGPQEARVGIEEI